MKNERKIERFDKYMIFKHLNDNKVTHDLGLSVGTIGKSRTEGRDLSDRNIEKILNFYTDLDRVWLLTGEGEMLKQAGTSSMGEKPLAIDIDNIADVSQEGLMDLIRRLVRQGDMYAEASVRNSRASELQAEAALRTAKAHEQDAANLARLLDRWELNQGDSLSHRQGVG